MNHRQQVFVDEYLKCWKAAEAARRAGYSARTAYSMGPRLLKNVEVRRAIDNRLTNIHMGADEVLKLLADQARGDMADLMAFSTVSQELDLVEIDPKTGEVKPKPQTKLIKKLKQRTITYLAKGKSDEDREENILEIELYDAQAALALIGKHHKLFAERIEHSGEDGGPIQVEDVTLTDEQRVTELAKLLDAARARQAGQADPPAE